MLIDLIIFGTIAGATILAGSTGFFAKNSRPTHNMTKLQRKVEKGKLNYNSDQARKKMAKGILKQFHGMTFGICDIQTRVNSFRAKIGVNKDSDFEHLWEMNSFVGNSDQKLLYKYKAKECIKKLTGKKLSLIGTIAQKVRKAKISRRGIQDIMKEQGFMKAQIIDKGTGGSYLMPVAQSKDGTTIAHDCRYQMASDIRTYSDEDGEKSFDPNHIFGRIIHRKMGKCGTGRTKFARFSIDYPINKGSNPPKPDRFTLGCSNISNRNVMYQTSKFLILANACSKMQSGEVDKVRIIEGMSGNETCKILRRDEFRDYLKGFMNNNKLRDRCLDELEQIDVEAAKFANKVIGDFCGVRSTRYDHGRDSDRHR